jgi:hypothetical protein
MVKIIVIWFLINLFALALCLGVGNATPAFVIGGVCLVIFVLGLRAMFAAEHMEEGFAVLFFILIPSLASMIVLFGGSGIYYLVEYLK